MHRIARFRILLLALMVGVSHVALISHVAAHFQPALEQCELCVSQAHPQAAIPESEHTIPVEAWHHAAAGWLRVLQPATAPVHFYLQRAPPLPSP